MRAYHLGHRLAAESQPSPSVVVQRPLLPAHAPDDCGRTTASAVVAARSLGAAAAAALCSVQMMQTVAAACTRRRRPCWLRPLRGTPVQKIQALESPQMTFLRRENRAVHTRRGQGVGCSALRLSFPVRCIPHGGSLLPSRPTCSQSHASERPPRVARELSHPPSRAAQRGSPIAHVVWSPKVLQQGDLWRSAPRVSDRHGCRMAA